MAGPSAAARALAALPSKLAGFRRAGTITDFERLPGGAGAGASSRYAPATGERVAATVFMYDRGRPRQHEVGGGPEVAEELRMAASELNALARMGRYRSVSFEAGMDVGSPSGASSMRCAKFRIVQPDGLVTGDSICVSVGRGSFVKVRVTALTSPEPAVAGLLGAGLMSTVLQARKAV